MQKNLICYFVGVCSICLVGCSKDKESSPTVEAQIEQQRDYTIISNLNNESVAEFQLEDKFTVKIKGENYSVQMKKSHNNYRLFVLPRVDLTDITLRSLAPRLRCAVRDGDPAPDSGYEYLFRSVLVDESVLDRKITRMKFSNITMEEHLDAICESASLRYEVIEDVLYIYDDK